MFQQLLASKHHRLRDSRFGRVEVSVWSPTKLKKQDLLDLITALLKLTVSLPLQSQRKAHSKAVLEDSFVASAEINLESKHDFICHVAKVKATTSAHSMAVVIPFFSVFISLRIQRFDKTKRKYILPKVKKVISLTLSLY